MQERCVTFLQGDATSTVDTQKEVVHSALYPAVPRLRGFMRLTAAPALVLFVFVRNMMRFLSLQAAVNGFGFDVLKVRL